MSTISQIFNSYKLALTDSRDRYTGLYAERAENAREFYNDFFHKLVVPFRQRFSNASSREFIGRQIERFFGSRNIDFVAIDGTCQKDPFNDFIVFFGGAYGAKGQVSIEGEPPRVKYRRWEINKDVSMVAWVPVPFAQLSDLTGSNTEESFIVSDAERINLAGIHTMLMQLAEIFLAYNVAVSSTIDSPRLIMLDQSLSSIMAAVSHGANTELAGYPYDRRNLDQTDITIAFAHPFNRDLGTPSTKHFRRYTAILAYFDSKNLQKGQSIEIAQLAKDLGFSPDELELDIEYLRRNHVIKRDLQARTITMAVNCRESWAYTVSLFQNICTKLFIQKQQSALTYEKPDPDDPAKRRQAWMSPDDINFLIAVGLRAVIEACWQRSILLVGVVKDSASRYLTRNYLGAMKHQGVYPELQSQVFGLLPWTDRIFLEMVPVFCDETLEAPWSTIEFDSTFMTLHLGEYNGSLRISGTKTRGGEIVAPERLFVRSLAQFYLNRTKKTPLMGHVVFMDRLAHPVWDLNSQANVTIANSELGNMSPLVYKDREVVNTGQAIMMYLTNIVTRNHFPEVIGYPDPLHKADLGAKSVGDRVKGIIRSSEIPFRANPLAKTLRSIRDTHQKR